MSQSQGKDAFMSVRIVVMDHYQGEPVECLDPFTSERGYEIRRVPVLRVFGSTPAGQKTTLHLHGIFPYLYVPMPEKETDGFEFRLASSLDLAINTSLNQSKADIQHVYRAVRVTGRPFYGYHPKQHNFVKIYFYNYYMLKRASDLLSAGSVLGQVLQPHESHVPFELQFMMDYNLQGMNLIHLKHVMFRQGTLRDEYDDLEPFSDLRPVSGKSSAANLNSTMTSPHAKVKDEPPTRRFFDPDSVPDVLKLPTSLVRMSTSELEVDAVAADIFNCNDLVEGAMNPGLKALWEDERERRKKLNMSDPLTPPGSPPRPSSAYESSESEKFWLERFDKMLEEKKEREWDDTKDEPSSDPDATINIQKNLKPTVGASSYASETSDSDLTILPCATQLEPHVPTLSTSILQQSQSQSFIGTPRRSSSSLETPFLKRSSSLDNSVLDESQSYLDDTVLDETQVSLDDSDEDLVDMLADMVDDVDSGEDSAEDLVELLADMVDENAGEKEAAEDSPPQTSICDLVDRMDADQSSYSQNSKDACNVCTPPSNEERIRQSPTRPPSTSKQSSQGPSSTPKSRLSHSSQSPSRSSQPPSTPRSRSSQPPSQPDELFSQSLCLSEDFDTERPEDDEEEDLEILEMSQPLWASDPFGDQLETNDEALWDDNDDELLKTLGIED